jgi:hypothetical protein
MAAGLGFKDFVTGEVLTAADVDGYLMQGIWVFANATARDAAVTSPQEGNFAFLKDTNVTTYYTGSAWTNLDTTGMVNPMTTTGDTIYSSSGSTPARLGIGSTGDVLTVAGGVPSWAAPAGGGSYTSLASGSLSGTLDLQSISGSYRKLSLQLSGYSMSNNANIDIRLNNDSGTNYSYAQMYNSTSIYKEINQASIYAAANNAAETGGQVIFEIENYATACKHSGIAYNFADDAQNWNFTYWGWNNAAAVNRIEAIPQSGTFDAGTYVLYGVK